MPSRRRTKRSESSTSDVSSEVTKSKSSVTIIAENIQFILAVLGNYFLEFFTKFSQKTDNSIEIEPRSVTMATKEMAEANFESDITVSTAKLADFDLEGDSGHDDLGSHSSARASSDEAETDGGVQVSNSDDNEAEGNEEAISREKFHSEALPCEALPYEALSCEALPCEALPCKTLPCQAKLREALPFEGQPYEALPCEAQLCEATPTEAILREPEENVPCEAQYSRRRSSGSDTSEENIGQSEEERALVTEKLVTQLETMFSDEELAKDGFLLKHIRRRSDGYVSLKLVAGLRKVKQISKDFPTILEALKLSLKLDVNLEDTKVRRMEPLTPYLKALPTSRTCTPSNTPRPSIDMTAGELFNRDSLKNFASGNRSKRTRNYSAGSGRPGSRNGSLSTQGQGQTASKIPNLFDRKFSNEDLGCFKFAAAARRGSLPVSMLMNYNKSASLTTRGRPSIPGFNPNHRNSLATLPSDEPPKSRQKSNSYCEGTDSANGTSVWLQRRMATTRSSEGTIVLNGAIRQPRGPDGTKGFLNFGPSGWQMVAGKGKENQGPE